MAIEGDGPGGEKKQKRFPAFLLSAAMVALVTAVALAVGCSSPANAWVLEFPIARAATATPTATPSWTATSRFPPTPVLPTATATSQLTATPSPTASPTTAPTETPAPTLSLMVPLIDLGIRTYKGFQGGLYPGGSNLMPEAHAIAGMLRAQTIQPRDPSGAVDPDGRYIFLSIGISNTSREFCGSPAGEPCSEWSFVGLAANDPLVDHNHLVILNGATGGGVSASWNEPDDANYGRVRDEVLVPLGYAEPQVQIVWVKLANPNPTIALPGSSSDAYKTFRVLGEVLRSLRIRYPNVQQVFISSRIYAGYATTALNPEPFAYEYGFSVKWLIEAQIDQMAGIGIDPFPGDLNYDTVAPWAAWGPYLWGNGTMPRSDGLVWLPEDFDFDGTHPSMSGVGKVADLLMDFFSTSPFTSCWFLAEGICVPETLDTGRYDPGRPVHAPIPEFPTDAGRIGESTGLIRLAFYTGHFGVKTF